jgi:hypothetical protein
MLFAWWMGARAGFGMPAFIALTCGALFFFGTSERWAADTSAYSVFNTNGRRIAGTMSAEQIDAQLRSGGQADVREAGRQIGGHWWGSGHALDAKPAAATTAAPTPSELRERRAAAADAAQARLTKEAGPAVVRSAGTPGNY